MTTKPRIQVLPGTFDIHRLPPDAEAPAAVLAATFVWTARTADELSIVCRPDEELAARATVSADWAALQVEGPLDFSIVGLLADLSDALAAAGLSIFAISTFDTDYVLVRQIELERGIAALAEAGYEVLGSRT